MSRSILSLCLVAAFAVVADAGTIKGLLASLDPDQLWSDNSGDFLADFDNGGAQTDFIGGGALAAKAAGQVDVGDVLVGQFSINSIEEFLTANPAIAVPGVVGQEFTGAFAIEVVGKTILGNDNFNWLFAPVSAAKVGLLPVAVAAEVGSWAAGAMAAFYADSSLDYTRLDPGPTIDTAFGTSVNGTQLFQMGFTGSAAEIWVAGAVSDSIITIGNTPPPGNGGSFNLSVNRIPGTGDPDIVFGLVDATLGGQVNLNGSGSLLGTNNVDTPYDSFNNIDFVVDVAVVPEPSSLAIWGVIGVAGVVCQRRRRKNG